VAVNTVDNYSFYDLHVFLSSVTAYSTFSLRIFGRVMVIFVTKIVAVRQVGFGQTVFDILCFLLFKKAVVHFFEFLNLGILLAYW